MDRATVVDWACSCTSMPARNLTQGDPDVRGLRGCQDGRLRGTMSPRVNATVEGPSVARRRSKSYIPSAAFAFALSLVTVTARFFVAR
jgi:hypothetical protein